MRPNTSYPLRTRKPAAGPGLRPILRGVLRPRRRQEPTHNSQLARRGPRAARLAKGQDVASFIWCGLPEDAKIVPASQLRGRRVAAVAAAARRPAQADSKKASTVDHGYNEQWPSNLRPKGWAHAATGAESAQEASQRFNLKDVEALARIDYPPMPLALAGAALLLAVREVPFEELTWPHFVKFVDRYGAEALVAAVRSVDAREVPDFKRRALQHFLGDDEPDFSLVSKECERAWFRADAWIRSVLYAADAAAAARVGADETARKASRQASREVRERRRDLRNVYKRRPAGPRPSRTVSKPQRRAGPTSSSVRSCARTSGPTPTARRAPPLARRSCYQRLPTIRRPTLTKKI